MKYHKVVHHFWSAPLFPRKSMSDLPGLSSFLQNTSNFLNEYLCRWILSVDLVICLSDLSGFSNEDTEIWAHSRVDETDVWADRGDFLKDGGVE